MTPGASPNKSSRRAADVVRNRGAMGGLAALLALGIAANHDCYLLRLEQCGGAVTIHGLWPQWGEWCDAPPFNPATLAPIQSELDRWWPSCPTGGQGNTTWFHAHEWDKHGSCTGWTELEYFRGALLLREAYTPHLQTCLDRYTLEPCPCCDPPPTT